MPEPSNPPHMRTHSTLEPVDAVVIGTGAGGAPLLARLAKAGLKVVALEAGPRWNPQRDFATDERAQSNLFWNDERLSAGKDPLAFGRNNSGTGVGGSTLHYTAYVPRVQPDDLRLRTEFGVGADWPISFDDLEPYYTELEHFLGVSGPTPYPWGPKREPYPLGPLPLNGAAQLMARGAKAIGLRTSAAANAALSAAYHQDGVGWRAACTNRGFCQAGCSTGAKASMDATFIPYAVHYGAQVRDGCFVTQLETNRAGRVKAVIYVRDGLEVRQPCQTVFLCAGAIETPRFLLLNQIGNSSGQVGRNFMAHVGVQVWGRFEDDVRPYKGIPGGLISEDTHRPQRLEGALAEVAGAADFAGGYLVQSIGVMPVTYASQVARGRGLWGEALKDHMRGYNHTAGINVLGDCLPSEQNFLALSDETDARGLPKPRVHFTAGQNEQRMTVHAEALMRALWAQAGAQDVWAFQRFAHIIGTCRMGSNETSAVVNPDGRIFDLENVYICDNSIFPSALSVNPALTIMALSLRTADRFLERSKPDELVRRSGSSNRVSAQPASVGIGPKRDRKRAGATVKRSVFSHNGLRFSYLDSGGEGLPLIALHAHQSELASNSDHCADWLESICPALLIRALQSEVTTAADLERMAARRPNTRLVTLRGGHIVHAENPGGFEEAVRTFLRETDC
jgi:choline dehydrogenase-like flavoprotein